MLQGILIIVVFLVIAALMMTKKIPTLLALPLMAVIICIIAGVPAVGTDAEGNAIGWLQTVVENGTVRMGSAIMAVIFGAWLGQLMNKTGVTENIIKKSAELGGDRPLVVTLIMVVAVAILFTTLSGLGSIIMVGSIVLPILVSVGVPAISAACIFLMAFTTGLTFNIANWKSFSSIFGLEIEQIKSFEIYLLIATLIATLVLVFVEFKKNGVKFAFSAPVSDVPETRQLKGVAGTLAMLTPLVPILLVALLKVPVVPAFVAGIIWVLVFTSKSFSKAMNLLVKTCYDGITDAGPAVILMIGVVPAFPAGSGLGHRHPVPGCDAQHGKGSAQSVPAGSHSVEPHCLHHFLQPVGSALSVPRPDEPVRPRIRHCGTCHRPGHAVPAGRYGRFPGG